MDLGEHLEPYQKVQPLRAGVPGGQEKLKRLVRWLHEVRGVLLGYALPYQNFKVL